MMGSLFTKTLYQKRFLMLGWFLGLAAMIIFTVVFFPSLKTGDIAQSFDTLPESLRALAGDAASFSTIEGYVSQQVFAFRAPLLVLILAVAVFCGLTAGDEQRKVLETQLSLPFRRSKILLHKLAAGIVVVAVACVGIFAGVVLGLLMIGESHDMFDLVVLTLACLLVSLGYGMLTFAIGAVTGRKGLTLAIAGGFTFLSYLINSMALSVSALESLDKATLFHYYTPGDMSAAGWLVLVIVPIVLAVVGFIGFNKRDLKN